VQRALRARCPAPCFPLADRVGYADATSADSLVKPRPHMSGAAKDGSGL
jgi:hypothetical protein